MVENKAVSRKGKKRIFFNEKTKKTAIREPIRVHWRDSSAEIRLISGLFIVGNSPIRFRIPVPIQTGLVRSAKPSVVFACIASLLKKTFKKIDEDIWH
jgi:hypothetical protein